MQVQGLWRLQQTVFALTLALYSFPHMAKQVLQVSLLPVKPLMPVTDAICMVGVRQADCT